MKKYDFMILAGGTGGHVFPAVSVGKSLIDKGYKVCWAGKVNGLEEKQAREHKIDFVVANSPVWQRKSRLYKIFVIFELLRAIFHSYGIMKEYNPKVVIGFGGAISVALGICAALQGRKLILHEQNAKAGKANKLLSLFANKIMIAFPGLFGSKSVLVGNPLRQELIEGAVARGKKELKAPFKVLVLGGSNGSDGLNKLVVEAFNNLGQDFEIWHQAGVNNVAATYKGYAESGKDAHVVEFIDNMPEAYAWADLVISRSGALTIAEILAYGLPSVLVPNPYSADNHQYFNASYIASCEAAVVVVEKKDAAAAISNRVLYMLANPKYYLDMVAHAEKLAITDAADKMVAICVEIRERG